jgi:hypothetical protein
MIEQINNPVTKPATEDLRRDHCKIVRAQRNVASHPIHSNSQN